ncbi:PREDICTED: protein FAR1-RELATED SEQUENCE 7-like isoform X1 [Ipomoea nil]|uniref:protein FAR1-RELATED SEQUENCE 7-like isoform X1 n=2 Tax=Ipomoea nil TaxID=35883 RepID=UPI000901C5C3|nr:PREDICTED: protein FAR1-RELATED SEQUENCE 7-like isoform X1 [Ipomoea nil]XP_019178404.1 PREDICTED: protein FAR1-RELATED SEQUENCE 7-like isoform X1 [Ipomoea nil]
MDIEVEAAIGDSSASAERRLDSGEESRVQEPVVGMEFESEDAAKEFYDNYARRAGFVMRIDQCRRSEVDKRILSRRLSCNKQGYYVKMKDQFGPARKPRTSTREGCKAMMLVKVDKSGKWVVTRFVKEHTHPLIVSGRPSRNAMDHKDRRIHELTMELNRQDRLCELYRDQLNTLLKYIEEQIEVVSGKVQVVVSNVNQVEKEARKPPNQ